MRDEIKVVWFEIEGDNQGEWFVRSQTDQPDWEERIQGCCDNIEKKTGWQPMQRYGEGQDSSMRGGGWRRRIYHCQSNWTKGSRWYHNTRKEVAKRGVTITEEGEYGVFR